MKSTKLLANTNFPFIFYSKEHNFLELISQNYNYPRLTINNDLQLVR